jgi:hypothetical protein
MCFSANASFAASGALAVIGIATLRETKTARERFLAAMPLFFSVQQAIEGFEWLARAPSALQTDLAYAFLAIAVAFWPVYIPAVVYLVEAEKKRKRLLGMFIMLGVVVSAYSLMILILHPIGVVADSCCHIRYSLNMPLHGAIAVCYVAATCGSLIASGHRWLVTLGVTAFIALLVSFDVTAGAVISVWCFFAALLSIMIFMHFYYAKIRAVTKKFRLR